MAQRAPVVGRLRVAGTGISLLPMPSFRIPDPDGCPASWAESVLTAHRFCTCHPASSTETHWWPPVNTLSALGQAGGGGCWSPSSECQQGSSYCLFSATFSALLCFLWVISLFRVAPKCHAEVLSRVSGRLGCASQRKLCYTRFPQDSATVLVVLCWWPEPGSSPLGGLCEPHAAPQDSQ